MKVKSSKEVIDTHSMEWNLIKKIIIALSSAYCNRKEQIL